MPVSRAFYFFVCSAATLLALFILMVGHFSLIGWVGIGIPLIICWLYGLKSKTWKKERS